MRSTAARGADGPTAEERVARIITVVTGIGALFLGFISLGSIFEATAFLTPPYTLVAVSLIFGGYLALVIVTFNSTMRVIRIAHGAYAIGFLAVQFHMIPALGAEPFPQGLNPWMLEMPAIGATSAAIAWRSSGAWIYLISISVLEAPLRWLAHGRTSWDVPLQYAILTLILAGLFTALAIAAMRNAAAVDSAAALLRDAAARSAAASARAQEQARLDALVHDEVMNTLFYASRGDAALEAPLRRQAIAALAELEMLRNGRAELAGVVTANEFVSRIRSVVLDASIDIAFTTVGERERVVPGDVAAAFAEATSEAARNSLTHAPDATRAVTVRLSSERIEVTITDDGPGFDARDVAPHRLGILVSIRGRLAAVDGGGASVNSFRGRGTVVTLSWRQP